VNGNALFGHGFVNLPLFSSLHVISRIFTSLHLCITAKQPGRSYLLNFFASMVTDFLLLIHLILYATVVSQPLFYLIAMTQTTNRLQAPAYIEMRNNIDNEMRRRGPAMYYSALGSGILLLAVSLYMGATLVWVTAALALICLIADLRLALTRNVPINGVIQTWTPTQYPPDWAQYRAKWLAVFSYRQVLLVVGFTALLVGAVFK
jgi:hypothetical protein